MAANENLTQFSQLPYIDDELRIRCSFYITFGILVCISSVISITVFSSKDLRTKYMMFFALSAADLVNGLSFIVSGIFRNIYMFQGQFFIATTNMYCLFHTPWAILMLLAGRVLCVIGAIALYTEFILFINNVTECQFPALIHLFIALERAVALQFAGWYRTKWKDVYRIYLALFSVVLTLVFFLLAVMFDMIYVTTSPSRLCSVMESTGIIYGTFHYTFIAFIHVFCFTVLWFIFKKTNKNRESSKTLKMVLLRKYDCDNALVSLQQPSKDEFRRQPMMLAIAGISVILVSIPNLALILDEWNFPKMDTLVVGVIYCLYATHSSFSLFVYLIFRPDFRFRLMSLIGFKKLKCFVIEPSYANAINVRSITVTKVVAS